MSDCSVFCGSIFVSCGSGVCGVLSSLLLSCSERGLDTMPGCNVLFIDFGGMLSFLWVAVFVMRVCVVCGLVFSFEWVVCALSCADLCFSFVLLWSLPAVEFMLYLCPAAWDMFCLSFGADVLFCIWFACE